MKTNGPTPDGIKKSDIKKQEESTKAAEVNGVMVVCYAISLFSSMMHHGGLVSSQELVN